MIQLVNLLSALLIFELSSCPSSTNFILDSSIQTWALKEAKARMEARGDKVEYKPS